MARVKPKNMITNRAQAEAAMSKINQIDRQFAEWDLNEAQAVAKIREQFAAHRKKSNYIGLEAERSLLIKEIHAWAEVDSANWEKKTLETPFGKLGFRVSQPTVVLVKRVAKSFKQALDLLKATLPDFVREISEIDKEKILAAERDKILDATGLKMCGLEVKHDDEFWIESNAAKDLDEAAKKLKAA